MCTLFFSYLYWTSQTLTSLHQIEQQSSLVFQVTNVMQTNLSCIPLHFPFPCKPSLYFPYWKKKNKKNQVCMESLFVGITVSGELRHIIIKLEKSLGAPGESQRGAPTLQQSHVHFTCMIKCMSLTWIYDGEECWAPSRPLYNYSVKLCQINVHLRKVKNMSYRPLKIMCLAKKSDSQLSSVFLKNTFDLSCFVALIISVHRRHGNQVSKNYRYFVGQKYLDLLITA